MQDLLRRKHTALFVVLLLLSIGEAGGLPARSTGGSTEKAVRTALQTSSSQELSKVFVETSIEDVLAADGHSHFLDVSPGIYNIHASFIAFAIDATQSIRVPPHPLFEFPEEMVAGEEAIVATKRSIVEVDRMITFGKEQGLHRSARQPDLGENTKVSVTSLEVVDSPVFLQHMTYEATQEGSQIFGNPPMDFVASGHDNPIATKDLSSQFQSIEPGYGNFLVTANASGPLDPPAYAAITWNDFPNPEGLQLNRARQQSNGSIWVIHAGGASQPFASFVNRSTRNGSNLSYIGIRDYEMRFTQRCASQINGTIEPGDCLGHRAFGDGSLIEIPFEIWDTGILSPDDPNDDVRLVPIICDTNTCGGGTEHGIFDIGGDHVASSAANDPFTDWVYWYPPEDMTPGEVGHDKFFSGEDTGTGHEIMARIVLVGWNLGTAPP